MIINPPDEYSTPVKEKTEVEPSTFESRRWTELYLNVNSWKCASCGLTNFGRNLKCADQRCGLPRPTDYKKRKSND